MRGQEAGREASPEDVVQSMRTGDFSSHRFSAVSAARDARSPLQGRVMRQEEYKSLKSHEKLGRGGDFQIKISNVSTFALFAQHFISCEQLHLAAIIEQL